MFKRILVPLDGSRFGSRATRYAVEIATHFNAEVVLMQVVNPAIPMTETTGMEPVAQSPAAAKVAIQIALDADKRNVARARRYLGRKAREMAGRNIKSSYQVVVGDPASIIKEFARKDKIDLIIMTTHGKGGIIRAVMGSVADEVVRKSGKPVLVIRPNKRSEK